jgi:hypothetical protein
MAQEGKGKDLKDCKNAKDAKQDPQDGLPSLLSLQSFGSAVCCGSTPTTIVMRYIVARPALR